MHQLFFVAQAVVGTPRNINIINLQFITSALQSQSRDTERREKLVMIIREYLIYTIHVRQQHGLNDDLICSFIHSITRGLLITDLPSMSLLVGLSNSTAWTGSYLQQLLCFFSYDLKILNPVLSSGQVWGLQISILLYAPGVWGHLCTWWKVLLNYMINHPQII